MIHYNIHVELDKRDPTEDDIMSLLTYLEQGQFNPSVGTSPRGYLSARVTVPSAGLVQAVMSTVATVQQLASTTALAVEAMTEAEFDAREGFAPIPEMLSVTEVSELLGVKRQRVLQMISEHKFPSAQQVGSTWVIASSDAQAKAVPTGLTDMREGETNDEYAKRITEGTNFEFLDR
jgi:excisionase family DNA binding protein